MLDTKKKQTTKIDINKAISEVLAELIRQDFNAPLRWTPNMAQLGMLRQEKMAVVLMGRRVGMPKEILDMLRASK